MKRTRSRVGPISVYLTREQINALMYLLDCFPAADSNNKLASDAEKLKRKIMLHGRTFTDRGDEKVSLYFFEEEAAKLILLTSVYVAAFGNPANDYYPGRVWESPKKRSKTIRRVDGESQVSPVQPKRAVQD